MFHSVWNLPATAGVRTLIAWLAVAVVAVAAGCVLLTLAVIVAARVVIFVLS